MITQEELKRLFIYNPGTGEFIHTTSCRYKSFSAGDRAGTINKGYVMIRIPHRVYSAHRLAWLYMTGGWPKNCIDHINLERSDNRWLNLREATFSQNHCNKRKQSNNTSGLKGVTRHSVKWRAKIKIGDKHVHLGLFDCPAAAAFAYMISADAHFGEFARYA